VLYILWRITQKHIAYPAHYLNDIVSYQAPVTNQRTVVNAGETLHKGIEFGLGAPVTDTWRIDASLSYAKHTYEQWKVSGTADYSGFEMESAPRLITNTRLTYAPGYMNGGHVQLEWFKLGSYYHDQANTTKYSGHNLVNLRANYPIEKRWEAFGSINNLFDKQYAETVGMDGTAPTYSTGLPRTFVVGVQAKW
jgi:outer membrane receptor protein involved in Fe transport